MILAGLCAPWSRILNGLSEERPEPRFHSKDFTRALQGFPYPQRDRLSNFQSEKKMLLDQLRRIHPLQWGNGTVSSLGLVWTPGRVVKRFLFCWATLDQFYG